MCVCESARTRCKLCILMFQRYFWSSPNIILCVSHNICARAYYSHNVRVARRKVSSLSIVVTVVVFAETERWWKLNDDKNVMCAHSLAPALSLYLYLLVLRVFYCFRAICNCQLPLLDPPMVVLALDRWYTSFERDVVRSATIFCTFKISIVREPVPPHIYTLFSMGNSCRCFAENAKNIKYQRWKKQQQQHGTNNSWAHFLTTHPQVKYNGIFYKSPLFLFIWQRYMLQTFYHDDGWLHRRRLRRRRQRKRKIAHWDTILCVHCAFIDNNNNNSGPLQYTSQNINSFTYANRFS